MPQFKRTDRINEQLKQEITLLVRDEVRDPRVGLATVTAVATSPELDHAKVYFTTLGDDEEQEGVLAGLRSAAPFIRSQLGKRLHMRRIPELHFQVDRVLEEANRIERLLREALPADGVSREEGTFESTAAAESADADPSDDPSTVNESTLGESTGDETTVDETTVDESRGEESRD